MKKILIVMIGLLLMGCGLISDDFEDRNLKIGIERVLKQQGLRKKDYDELTHLDLSYLNIKSLEGIGQLNNLESLDLSDNSISDLSPLSDLKELRILDLQYNRITDLSVLAELSNLEVLLLRNNPIDSIQSIEGLFSQLKTTDFLVHVSFEDPMFEAYIRQVIDKPSDQITYYDLSKIHKIDLSGTEVTNISGIEHARNLEQLVIKTPVVNLIKIAGLENLKELEIGHNRINNISFLSRLQGLTYLNLNNNSIENIDLISEFKALNYLDLSYNKISDISAINTLENLSSLFLLGNPIIDYESIVDVFDVIETTDIFIVYFNDINLDLAIRENLSKKNGVVTINDLKNIKSLDASNYGIVDLGGIELLESLVDLNLGFNDIKSIDALGALSTLKVLKLNDNSVEEIQALSYLSELEILDLSNNMIVKVDPLLYIEQLDYLYLRDNPIEENTINDEIKSKIKFTDEW